MPPNDSPLPNGDATPTPEPTPEPTPPQGMVPNDLVDRLGDALKVIGDNLQEIKAGIATPATTEPTPPAGDQEVFNEFLADPDKFVATRSKGVVESLVKDQLQPILNGVVGAQLEGLRGDDQTKIDAQFGAGTWEELFKPAFDRAFGSEANSTTADPNSWHTTRKAIMGHHYEELTKREIAQSKKRAEDPTLAGPTGVLVGGNPISTPKPEGVDPQVRGMLESMAKATGKPVMSDAEFLAMREVDSLEDFKALKKAREKAEKEA